jgi:hypothetical protein
MRVSDVPFISRIGLKFRGWVEENKLKMKERRRDESREGNDSRKNSERQANHEKRRTAPPKQP